MNLTLNVWRQAAASKPGDFKTYPAKVSTDASFLEMLDQLNDDLEEKGEEPIAFDHDCREGICGMCSLMINGQAHGPEKGTTVCQLHMRSFKNGETLWIEPWRAGAFPLIKDLVVDRNAMDRIIEAGGYVSVNTGSAPDAHAVPVGKEASDKAFDAATCIGCGACVASCPNASAMLFTGAKVAQLQAFPQGQPERERRVLRMVGAMDDAGFGNCSNHLECEAACPKEISVENIAALNREYLRASLCYADDV
ncbi:MAG: succinate dehydrogenase/fumarate reductase iron-sulfur subunit [Planctomycetota bacterium]